MFTLVTTERFLRNSRKFLKQHPDLRDRFAQVLAQLREDPFAPQLSYHPLSGKYEGVQAIHLTYNYRIILSILITEKEIILLDVGSHDEVYR